MSNLRIKVIATSALALVAATGFIASPAQAAAVTYTVNCADSGPDITQDIPMEYGQDAIFNFSPAGCTHAYWSMMNPAIPDNTSNAATTTFTIAAADAKCGNQWEITKGSGYYYLTFTGHCGPALPNTGVDVAPMGIAGGILVGAGLIAMLAYRRRTS